MSMPSVLVMPADGAFYAGAGKPATFTVPGTGRRYECGAGSAIAVPGEDAVIMCSSGWVSGFLTKPGASGGAAEGTTAQRPTTNLFQNTTYDYTTLGTRIVWGGHATGWLNSITGANV
jgi:hypothetical protein